MTNKSEVSPIDDLRVLFQKNDGGRRACVPVFGTGLNIQAAVEEGYPHQDGWAELLVKIGTKIGLTDKELQTLPKTHLALWENLLCQWAKYNGVFPYEAEGELQSFVTQELRAQEKDSQNFQLYKRIAQAHFDDMISLNFDRRIALSVKKNQFVVAPNPCPYGAQGESLFRHSVIPQKTGDPTHVWYPHGDVKKASTIKLGVRRYGFYISIFREYLRELDDTWRKKIYSTPSTPRTAVDKNQAANWIDVFMSRPLVFIGCGLSPNEWPLIWLLRERDFSRKSEISTYFLTISNPKSEAQLTHLSLIPSMKIVAFESPQALWDTFLGWISDD